MASEASEKSVTLLFSVLVFTYLCVLVRVRQLRAGGMIPRREKVEEEKGLGTECLVNQKVSSCRYAHLCFPSQKHVTCPLTKTG